MSNDVKQTNGKSGTSEKGYIFGDFIDESKYEVDIGRRVDAESRYEQPTFSKMTRPC